MKRLIPVALLAAAWLAQIGLAQVCFAQTDTTPPSAAPVAGILNYIHAVNDLDRTLAFYHDVFGLDAPAPRPLPSPGIPALTNSPGVTLRLSTLHFPNTVFGFELTQFSGVDRKPGQARHTDPGAALIALRVKDMEPVLAAVKKMNVPIITTSGAPVTIVSPNGKLRSLLIRDPDGYVVEVVESAPPADASAAGNVYGASMGLTIGDVDTTRKFYHDLLGFDLKGKMEFTSDPPIVDLIGAPHAKFREFVGNVRGVVDLVAGEHQPNLGVGNPEPSRQVGRRVGESVSGEIHGRFADPRRAPGGRGNPLQTPWLRSDR